jgi:enoyl-CoA hydratase/carnithine racemase
MTYSFIRVASEAQITTIILNRPEVMNAINPAMHVELQAAFDGFAADDDQRICVVTGAGERAFCAGSDLKAAAAAGGLKAVSYPPNGYAGLIQRFDLSKPVIAAVNGVALGGGFEIALSCDLIIAAENAKFGLPEPLVGAVALGGGVHRLVRQTGLKQAMAMLLTSESVTAAEGKRLGFVNEVVPQAELASTVKTWCEKILRGAPSAIRASKDTAMRGLNEPLADAIAHQRRYPEFAAWLAGDDIEEGPRAFAEKRKPNWLND